MSTPEGDPEDVVAKLVAKATVRAPLLGKALGGIQRETPKERERKDRLIEEAEEETRATKADRLSAFKEGFTGALDVEVDRSAWKHGTGGEEENRTTIRLMRELGLKDDESVARWLYQQDWGDFTLTDRNRSLINFSVYLDDDTDQHMSGYMRRRPRRGEASVVVKHIGPGGRQ